MARKLFYSVTELSNLLGVHRNTIIYWITKHYLRAHNPKGKYFITTTELERFLGSEMYEAIKQEN